mgnify:CR=1 FL=1
MLIENIEAYDIDEINDLLVRNGLTVLEYSSSKLIKYVNDEGKEYPIGWKLIDTNGVIRGTVFSLMSEYQCKKKKYIASTISTFVIDQGYRGNNAIRLLQKFINHKNVDLIINGSAIKPVAKRLKKMEFSEMKNSDFKNIYFWITNYQYFLKFVIKKYNLPSVIFYPLNLFLILIDKLIYFSNNQNSKNIKILDYLPENYDSLFKDSSRFGLMKSRKSLYKRIQNGLNKKKCILFFYGDNLGNNGYALVDIHQYENKEIEKITIFDILSNNNSEKTINCLVQEIIKYAKKSRYAFVELYGLPKNMLYLLKKNKPFKRKFETDPFYYKVLNKDLLEVDEFKNWSPTVIDTDRSFY